MKAQYFFSILSICHAVITVDIVNLFFLILLYLRLLMFVALKLAPSPRK